MYNLTVIMIWQWIQEALTLDNTLPKTAVPNHTGIMPAIMESHMFYKHFIFFIGRESWIYEVTNTNGDESMVLKYFQNQVFLSIVWN